jgi:hypothetical protein
LVIGYSYTLLQTCGQLANPSTTGAMVMKATEERQVIWMLPAVLYGVQTGYEAFANYDTSDEAAAAKAKALAKLAASPKFLAGAGLAEGLIFLYINNSGGVNDRIFNPIWQGLRTAVGAGPSDSAKLARGDMVVEENDGNAGKLAKIRDTFQLATRLSQVPTKASEVWDEVDTLGVSTKQLLSEKNDPIDKFSNTLESLIGRIKEESALLTAEDKSEKRKVGLALMAAGSALGIVVSLGAAKVPALLTDYAPYFITAVLNQAMMMNRDTVDVNELARSFGSYFGEPTLTAPFAIANLISLFATGDGLFDIVSSGNSTEPSPPTLAAANTPGVHILDGKLNFGVAVGVALLLSLTVGDKPGTFIAQQVLARMRSSAAEPQAEENAEAGEGLSRRLIQQLIRAAEAILCLTPAAVEGDDGSLVGVQTGDIPLEKVGPSSTLPPIDAGADLSAAIEDAIGQLHRSAAT